MSEANSRALAHSEPFDDVAWAGIPRVFQDRGSFVPRAWRTLEEHGLHPATDVFEDEDRFILTVELPGARRRDIAVEVQNRDLTIRGEKRCEREKEREHHRTFERRYGTFSRSFALPPDADPSRVAAKLDDGVLTVTVGKAGEAKPRTVEIRS